MSSADKVDHAVLLEKVIEMMGEVKGFSVTRLAVFGGGPHDIEFTAPELAELERIEREIVER